MPQRSSNTDRTSIFKASNVVLSRATTSTECNGDETVTPSGKISLKTTESHSILRFLVDRAVFSSEDQAVTPKQKSRLLPILCERAAPSAEPDALTCHALNSFIGSLFRGDPPEVITRYLVTFVEVKDIQRFSIEPGVVRPPKFTFVVRQVVITRIVKKLAIDLKIEAAMEGTEILDSSDEFQFFVRDRSTVVYTHSHVGAAAGHPQLDMHCDRAAFVQAPEARFMFDLRSHRHRESSPLRELLEFMLFPARELRRVMWGEAFLWQKHMEATFGGSPANRSKSALDENIFKRVISSKLYPSFSKEALKLSSRNTSPFLDRLKIASVSFAFHVQRSESCVASLLREEGLSSESDRSSIDQATNNSMRRLVAAQHATFESRVYYGSEMSSFKHSVLTSVKTKRATNGWTARSEWALDAYLASPENQSIESVTLTAKTERNTFYTINLGTHDRTATLRSLKNSDEYETIRERVVADGGVAVSADDKASQMANTLTVTVTAHPRVLDNDLGIRSASMMRDHILTEHNGDVESFAKNLIQAAFDKSGISYWNGRRHWDLALTDNAGFEAIVSDFVSKRVARGVFSNISEERWDFLSSLPKALKRYDEDVLLELRVLARKVGKIQRGPRAFASGAKRPDHGILSVPEFAISLLCYWFTSGSEMSWDIFKSSELLPMTHKKAFFANRSNERDAATGKQTLQGEVGVLLADCKQFVLENFGVNIEHSRDLHKEVWRHRAAALYGRRSKISQASQGSLEGVLPKAISRDQTSSFLNEFVTGQMFVLASNKENVGRRL